MLKVHGMELGLPVSDHFKSHTNRSIPVKSEIYAAILKKIKKNACQVLIFA
jgi:hypothetical protein